MGMAKQAGLRARLGSLGLGAAGVFALLLSASQLHCADAEGGWTDDASTNNPDGGRPDGGNGDGGDDTRCFDGTATTELQLLNHCTGAEQVLRASQIPTKTWDGTTPLPYAN